MSTWLAITPRDTVFVRDGRSFDAATDAVTQTVWPGPTTVAGAIGAASGVVAGEVRGPVLACRGGAGWTPYFPAPADLVVSAAGSGRTVFRLRPEQPAGQTDLGEAAAPRWLMPPLDAEPVEPLRGWIPGGVLSAYLSGDLPDPDGSPLEDFEPLRRGGEPADPLLPERRVGLARDDRSAREGYLYQSTHLRAEEGWAFLAEYTGPAGQVLGGENPVPFGGKGRLADIGPAAMSWPAPGPAGERVLVYLATPAVWPGGWRLPVPEAEGARLVAAATGEPEPAATVRRDQREWRGSRVLRWAVPAGSVYLLEFGDAEAGARWAASRHGTALDRGTDQETDLLRTAGFGVALTGAWT
jgi:CRISPR type III-B/RAMP module-associated protein Cmr3